MADKFMNTGEQKLDDQEESELSGSGSTFTNPGKSIGDVDADALKRDSVSGSKDSSDFLDDSIKSNLK